MVEDPAGRDEARREAAIRDLPNRYLTGHYQLG